MHDIKGESTLCIEFIYRLKSKILFKINQCQYKGIKYPELLRKLNDILS